MIKKLILVAMTATLALTSCMEEISVCEDNVCELYVKIEEETQTKTVLDKTTTSSGVPQIR